MKVTAQIGQQYVRKGARLFAVPKPQGIVERIASQTFTRGGWVPANRCSGRARVIVNVR